MGRKKNRESPERTIAGDSKAGASLQRWEGVFNIIFDGGGTAYHFIVKSKDIILRRLRSSAVFLQFENREINLIFSPVCQSCR